LVGKELESCTFKPKVNDDYNPQRGEGVEILDRSHRWDKLYKMGIQIISNKKDKHRDEIDKDLYEKHCTFQPNMDKTKEPHKDDGKHTNDIYNEKSYELLYSRLKNGRDERKIKDSIHERGDFPEELQAHLNKNKTKEIVMSPKANTTVKSKSFHKIKNEDLNQNNLNNNNRVNPTQATTNSSIAVDDPSEHFNNDPERKDSIPLLIIDVNIRPGVKKKIYVFDGDTAEGLAEKFSKEHNLDADTKSKLQVLIQSHMSRLLMRIDEENHSISEKSSTYNLS